LTATDWLEAAHENGTPITQGINPRDPDHSKSVLPEYDKLGLGRIEVLTKPGADHWRGNLDYNHATDAWNSRNRYACSKVISREHRPVRLVETRRAKTFLLLCEPVPFLLTAFGAALS
jgi:hypothetical protein